MIECVVEVNVTRVHTNQCEKDNMKETISKDQTDNILRKKKRKKEGAHYGMQTNKGKGK